MNRTGGHGSASLMPSLRIDPCAHRPIYLQGALQLGQLVAIGRYPPGSRLPTIREMALHLNITPSTVAHAYLELTRAGLLSKRRGSGCYVATSAAECANRKPQPSLERYADALLAEATRLGVAPAVAMQMLEERAAIFFLSGQRSSEG